MTTSQRWTMLATILGTSMVFLDGTIVNLALPHIGRELPASLVSTLEGQTYVVGGYLAILAALLLLAGALADYYGRRRVFAIGLDRLRHHLRPVRPRADARAAGRRPPAPGRRRRAARAGVAGDHHGDVRRRGRPGPARSASGRPRPRPPALIGPILGGVLVDTVALAGGVPDQRAAGHPRPVVALRHMRRAGRATRRHGSTGSARPSRSSPSAAWRSGRSAARSRNWQDPVAWVALAIGAVALVAFPILMAAPAASARAARPVPAPAVRDDQPLDAADLRRAVHDGLRFLGLFLQNVLGYTATAAGLIGLPSALFIALLSARIGGISGRIGARPFLVAGPLAHGRRARCGARGSRPRREPWRSTLGDPSTLVPPPSTLIDVLPAILLFGARDLAGRRAADERR